MTLELGRSVEPLFAIIIVVVLCFDNPCTYPFPFPSHLDLFELDFRVMQYVFRSLVLETCNFVGIFSGLVFLDNVVVGYGKGMPHSSLF